MAHFKRLSNGISALIAGGVGLVVFLWPRKTTKLDYITTQQRDQWYGPIRYVPDPKPDNLEGIYIMNNFEPLNIVREEFPLIGRAAIHRVAAPSLRKALTEIQRAGLGHYIKSYAGGFYPRFVRGSQSNLSSHSYGTSIDINAGTNPQGQAPTAEQTALAPYFERNGWYWGDRFTSKRDPMHFEFVLPPKGIA